MTAAARVGGPDNPPLLDDSMNFSAIKPLSVRECVLLDVASICIALAREHPGEARTPVMLERVGQILNLYVGSVAAPPELDVRTLLPLTSGLYPTVVGTTDKAVRSQIADAAADVFAADSLIQPLSVESVPPAGDGLAS